MRVRMRAFPEMAASMTPRTPPERVSSRQFSRRRGRRARQIHLKPTYDTAREVGEANWARRNHRRLPVVCVVDIVIFFAVAFLFPAGFSRRRTSVATPSLTDEEGKPHHDFGNRLSDSSPTVTA